MDEGDRVAGTVMIAAAAGTVLAMGHHPSSAHDAALGWAVHGAMIALLAALIFGFAHVARRRGLGRPAVLAGLVAYAIAAVGHIGAATINGFAVPALAARGGVGHDLFLFAWEMNHAMAKLGVYATATAYLFWSADLLSEKAVAPRLLGAAGLIAGAVPAALLAAGAIRMNVAGALIVYAAQVGWAALAGLYVLRNGAARETLAPACEGD